MCIGSTREHFYPQPFPVEPRETLFSWPYAILTEYHIDTQKSSVYHRGMDKQRTIRLSEQDMQAIVAIREEYGLTSDSEAIRFALHTTWREIKRHGNPTQAPNKERPSHPLP